MGKEMQKGYEMRKKGIVTIFLMMCVLALALSLSLAGFSAVPAVADEEAEETFTQTVTYMEGEEVPTISESVDVDGATWTLVAVSDPEVDLTYTPETRTFTHTEQGTFATIEEATAAFSSTWTNDDADYPGELPLVGITYEAQGETVTYVVDETQVYGPYPTNETRDVPTSITTTLERDGETFDAVLTRAYVEWEEAEVNAAGMPISYNLVVTYRGAVAEERITGYVATAYYEGTLQASAQQMMVTATYRAPETVAAAAVVAPISETPTASVTGETAVVAEGQSANSALPVAVGAGVAAVAVAIAAFLLVRSRNVHVCSGGGEKLAKVRAKRKGEELHVAIPSHVTHEEGVSLLLRKDLCDGGVMVVRQAGKTIYIGEAKSHVVVSTPKVA